MMQIFIYNYWTEGHLRAHLKVSSETFSREKEISDWHKVRPRCSKIEKSGQSVIVTGKANVGKIIESDDRYTIWDVAKGVGRILLGAFHFETYFASTKNFCQMETAFILTVDHKRYEYKPLSAHFSLLFPYKIK